jgi:hypothetical protein
MSKQEFRNALPSLALMLMIAFCWFILHGRIVDATQVSFVYQEF